MLNLTKLKGEYTMAEAIYIKAFNISEEVLKAKPLSEIIADYAHLEENVEEALECLLDRQQTVLHRVFGDKKTLREVGDIFGITEERVRRIMNKAFERLSEANLKRILDGTLRQKRVAETTREERKAEVAERWARIGAEIEQQKAERWRQIDTQLSLGIKHLSVSLECRQKIVKLGATTIGKLLEKFPYDPQTNDLTGLAVAVNIEESDYQEIWWALFRAGLLIRLPELPDYDALKKAERVTTMCGNASKISDISIDQLGLSTKSRNCLIRGGMNSVGDILERLNSNMEEFLTIDRRNIVEAFWSLKIRKFGRGSIEEIIDRLRDAMNEYI